MLVGGILEEVVEGLQGMPANTSGQEEQEQVEEGIL